MQKSKKRTILLVFDADSDGIRDAICSEILAHNKQGRAPIHLHVLSVGYASGSTRSVSKSNGLIALDGDPFGKMSGKLLIAFERELQKHRPVGVLVRGNTNAALAAALAAAKLHIPVAHLVVGNDLQKSISIGQSNRRMIDHVSQLLFCSDQATKRRSLAEGLTRGVHVVGSFSERSGRPEKKVIAFLDRYWKAR